jgi:glycosyltransferase involved in cell wall biosynthesis
MQYCSFGVDVSAEGEHSSARAPSLSVVVPCYNEEQVLVELHRRLTLACRASVGSDYEIVLINDGSRDRSLAVMHQLADRDRHVIAVNLARNFGHELATTAGLAFARGLRVLLIDADLQDPPELLPQMMALLDAGSDVVYGQRRRRDGETRFKTVTATAFYRLLQRLADVEIPPDTGDFRLMTRRAVDVLNRMPEQHRFIRGMVSWIGLRQTPLLYDRDPRFAGETKYRPIKLLSLAVDAITGFSTIPLRIASLLGLAMGAISLAMLVYTLGSWLLGVAVTGWTSLSTILLIVSSVQLFVLGIFGEYLGRMYMQGKQRPLFIVESIYAAARTDLSPTS